MADLDDFFAKKDRKKSKSVKTFTSPEELVKKIEDSKQKRRKDRQSDRPQDGEDNGAMPADDEWREYEVAKKDYTGLKIQHLGTEGGQGGGGGQGGQGGEGGMGQGAGQQGQGQMGPGGKVGPWNKSDQSDGKEESAAPPPKEQPIAAPLAAPAAVGGYVSPALRNRPAQGGPQDAPLRRLAKMHAPDIHSEEYFPTLGGEKRGSGTSSGAGGGGAWTEAGGGTRGARPPPTATSRDVPLGNRFTSLTNDS